LIHVELTKYRTLHVTFISNTNPPNNFSVLHLRRASGLKALTLGIARKARLEDSTNLVTQAIDRRVDIRAMSVTAAVPLLRAIVSVPKIDIHEVGLAVGRREVDL
jgi:hypothetical protein